MVNKINPSRKKITVGVINYKRERGLKRLLESLAEQKKIDKERYEIRILVVENDFYNTEKEEIVKKFNSNFSFNFQYDCEPLAGIPYARNKVLTLSKDEDAVIFIDDDEIAPEDWLFHLLSFWDSFPDCVVTGPVKAIYPENCPEWAHNSPIFNDHQSCPHASFLGECYSNNVLIPQSILKNFPNGFDPFFRYTGSSDIHYFRQILCKGFKIILCADAFVYAEIDPLRLKPIWIIKRAFRCGAGDSISYLKTYNNIYAYLFIFKRMGLRLKSGLSLIFSGFFDKINTQKIMHGVWVFMIAIGTFCGILGINYKEYRRIYD